MRQNKTKGVQDGYMDNFLAVKKEYWRMGLKSIDLLLISQIEEFERNNCQCFITNEQFAEMFGESVSTIKRALDKLNEMKIIVRKTSFIDGNGRANRQRVLSINNRKRWKVQNEPTKTEMVGSNNDNGRVNSEEWKVHNEPIKENLKDNLKNNLLREDANAKKETSKKSKRNVEDLSIDEKDEILAHYQNRDMTYNEMYRHYNLTVGCLNKEAFGKMETDLRMAANKKHDEEKKLSSQNALISFGLSQSEGDELVKYLFDDEYITWDNIVGAEGCLDGYCDACNMSAPELLDYLKNNEYARCSTYKRNHVSYGDSRFIINEKYRWDCYGDYLVSYVANPDDIVSRVQEYEKKKPRPPPKK